jgi:hypothetical protein
MDPVLVSAAPRAEVLRCIETLDLPVELSLASGRPSVGLLCETEPHAQRVCLHALANDLLERVDTVPIAMMRFDVDGQELQSVAVYAFDPMCDEHRHSRVPSPRAAYAMRWYASGGIETSVYASLRVVALNKHAPLLDRMIELAGLHARREALLVMWYRLTKISWPFAFALADGVGTRLKLQVSTAGSDKVLGLLAGEPNSDVQELGRQFREMRTPLAYASVSFDAVGRATWRLYSRPVSGRSFRHVLDRLV